MLIFNNMGLYPPETLEQVPLLQVAQKHKLAEVG